MQAVQITGRFVNDKGEPKTGFIKFIPQMIWLLEDDVAYPTFAPQAELMNGRFLVYVTRTDQHGPTWMYRVETPMGVWNVKIEDDGPISLKDLLPKKLA